MTTIKKLGYTFLALAMAMAITGCKGKTEGCCGTCKGKKPAVEKPAEAKVEKEHPAAPAKGKKPLDHPAH